MFFGSFVVLAGTDALFPASGAAPTWVLLGVAGLFLGYGLVRGVVRPPGGLPLQAVAMVVLGAVAVAAVLVGGDAGAYLVAAGLLAHAGWDLYHHRINRVVVRSMAEFCLVLDTLLAVSIVVIAVRS